MTLWRGRTTRVPLAARGASSAGVTLVELLVAVALLSLSLSTVAMLATAVLAGFEADPEAADLLRRWSAAEANRVP